MPHSFDELMPVPWFVIQAAIMALLAVSALLSQLRKKPPVRKPLVVAVRPRHVPLRRPRRAA